MEIFTSKDSMRQWSRSKRHIQESVALVPTMGALHQGHLKLVELAKDQADHVVVSIYVNPTQFNNQEDLLKYPRHLQQDLNLLEKVGCATVFAPESLYADGHKSWIELDSLGDHLCGASRPGHFKGVATIVTKLLNIVEPDFVVFGNKDYQQRKIIEQMIADLDIPATLIAAPIVREEDGLALSSRNLRLSPEARQSAVAIPKALEEAAMAFAAGERRVGALLEGLRQGIEEAGGELDYSSIVDIENLQPFGNEEELKAPALLALAAYFGGIRLIDNVLLG